MPDSFINFHYSQEANNYCPDNYNPSEEIIDEFRDSAKKIKDFKRTPLTLQGFENVDSFYYAILNAIRYQLNNKKIEHQNDDELKKDIDNDKKIEHQNDDELKKDIDNDELYDALSEAKEQLRLENQCFLPVIVEYIWLIFKSL